MTSSVDIITTSIFVDSDSNYNEALGACSDTIGPIVHMYPVGKYGYMKYMKMAHNCSCCPLLEKLYGHHWSLLRERMRLFVYVSLEPIFILLVHLGFTWISHVVSIIVEETHNLQKIIKTFDHVFFFPTVCRPSIYSLRFLHITGSDKIIQGYWA